METVTRDLSSHKTPNLPGYSFQNVSVSLQLPDKSWKVLLQAVSGYVRCGELLYIMGPSGAGKSTLLDYLTDRISSKCRVEGLQTLFGLPLTSQTLKDHVAYVPQEPVQFGCLSVREIFQFVARNTDRSTAEERLVHTASSLGLQHHLETPYGDRQHKGLSTGEQRRVCIGAAILRKPRLLLLDEPTSGLDSAASHHLTRYLRSVSHDEHLPILCAIHQPSQAVFDSADNILLLAEGRQVFFGSPKALRSYVCQNVGDVVFPPRMSIAEWSLFVLTRPYWAEGAATAPLEPLSQAWPKSEMFQHVQSQVETLHQETIPEAAGILARDLKSSVLHGFITLMGRQVKLALRDPSFYAFRFGLYVLLSVFIALVSIGVEGTEISGIQAVVGTLASAISFLPFLSSAIIPALLQEFTVVRWEIQGGLYNHRTYCLARAIIELFQVFILSGVCSAILYFPIPLVVSASRFFVFVTALWSVIFASDSLMFLLAAFSQNFIVASCFACAFFGVYFSLESYFLPVQFIGWYWQWLKYVNLLYYGFGVVMVNQFQNTSFPPSCTSPTSCFPTGILGTEIVRSYGLEERLWVGFLAIWSMAILFRFTGLVLLQVRLTGKK